MLEPQLKQESPLAFVRQVSFVMLFLLIFVASAFFAQRYEAELRELVFFEGLWGMLGYILLTIVAIVAAPLSTFPLLPLAAALWGSFNAAVLTIGAWTAGAVLAYALAQRYGRPLVAKVMNIEKIDALAQVVTGRHQFIVVVLLRMCLPVDILSYALGLFVQMPLWSYTLATLIGVAPFAFVFSYAANRSILTQVIILILAVLLAFFGYRLLRAKLKGKV